MSTYGCGHPVVDGQEGCINGCTPIPPDPADSLLYTPKQVNNLIAPRLTEIDTAIAEFREEVKHDREELRKEIDAIGDRVKDSVDVYLLKVDHEKKERTKARIEFTVKWIKKSVPFGALGGFLKILSEFGYF
jgi:hypothetical protein